MARILLFSTTTLVIGHYLRKIRLDIAVNEEFVESTISAITKGGKTGNPGDGKICVLDLPECIRIGT